MRLNLLAVGDVAVDAIAGNATFGIVTEDVSH